MVNKRLARMTLATTTVLVSLLGTSLAADFHDNASSHDAKFFRDLLIGRVWVVGAPRDMTSVAALYVDAKYDRRRGLIKLYWCREIAKVKKDGRYDGTGRYGHQTYMMRIRDDGDYHSVRKYVHPGVNHREGRIRHLLFYESISGQLHRENWDRQQGRWVVTHHPGWVQDGLPRAIKDACRHLKYPSYLTINEKQTSLRFRELRAQDPDAPIRNFPGSELRALGAVGTPMAEGRPPMVVRNRLKDFLEAHNGKLLRSIRDKVHHALMLQGGSGGHYEVWRLKPDSYEIEDVGHLVWSPDFEEIVVRFETLDVRLGFRLGGVFPLVPTGRRHAPTLLMDWLVAREGHVALPFVDNENIDFRFHADGRVEASRRDGSGPVPGTWRWSRGELVVQLEGIDSFTRYPWRELARHVGWTVPAWGWEAPAEAGLRAERRVAPPPPPTRAEVLAERRRRAQDVYGGR